MRGVISFPITGMINNAGDFGSDVCSTPHCYCITQDTQKLMMVVSGNKTYAMLPFFSTLGRVQRKYLLLSIFLQYVYVRRIIFIFNFDNA